MGFRFRRSLKILPGVRLNLGGKSASVRFGPRGAGYTVSSTGREHYTIGAPGTGLSYSQQVVPSAPASPAPRGAIAATFGVIGSVLFWVVMIVLAVLTAGLLSPRRRR